MTIALYLLAVAAILLLLDLASWYDLKAQGRRMGDLPILFQLTRWIRRIWRKS